MRNQQNRNSSNNHGQEQGRNNGQGNYQGQGRMQGQGNYRNESSSQGDWGDGEQLYNSSDRESHSQQQGGGYGQQGGYGQDRSSNQGSSGQSQGSRNQQQGSWGQSGSSAGQGQGARFGGQSSGQNQNSFGGESHGQNQNQGQRGRFEGKGPKGYKRSDEKLQEEICELLSDGHMDASEIEVKVSNGEVTLTGTVTERQDKHRAEQLAESVRGVSDVTNQLRVNRGGSGEHQSQSMGEHRSQLMGDKIT